MSIIKHYDERLAISQFQYLVLKFRNVYTYTFDFKGDEKFENDMLYEMITNIDSNLLINNKLLIYKLLNFCFKHKVAPYIRLNQARTVLLQHLNHIENGT